MFDTMTGVKVVGAFCGALLVFLLGTWAAESIYHVGGHGEEDQAYRIPVDEGDAPAEEEVEEVPFEEVFATADAAAGESIFRQCSACHRLEDGANATGPHLYDIVGRQIAVVPEYGYSSSLTELSGEQWSPENLSGFLEDPSGWAPGTKMTYSGLDDVEDRANLIAYLDTVGS